MTIRNFIKYMACNIDQKKKNWYSRQIASQIGMVKKKKKLCDKLGKKRIKELENRTVCDKLGKRHSKNLKITDKKRTLK